MRTLQLSISLPVARQLAVITRDRTLRGVDGQMIWASAAGSFDVVWWRTAVDDGDDDNPTQ